jgi:hypothetical protein
LFAVAVALARLGHDFMIRDGDAKLILQHTQRLDDVARTVADRARMLAVEGSKDGPIEQTEFYGKVRNLLDDWFTYAEELDQEGVDLNYTADAQSTTRKLPHEMLDPKLVNLSPTNRQFKAPRSMRDVEPTVAILPRRFKAPKAPIKFKNETTLSALRQSQLVTTYEPGAMIDLPWFAAVVGGLDFWDEGARISDPRLEAKAAQMLGGVTMKLAAPYYASDKLPDATTTKGVIAWKFPKWSITQETRRQSEPDGRTYQTRMLVPEAYLDDKGQYEGSEFDDKGKRRKLDVVPIRFIRACKNGHMGDIDWYNFVVLPRF